MNKQAFLVTMVLCRSGSAIAITLSMVRGSKTNILDSPTVYRETVYTTQYRVVLLFGAPTNLLSIIPSPLKKPRIDTRKSLTATLMIKRLDSLQI